MRVKVEYVVEVDDEFRRLIRGWYGKPGLATRQEVKDWMEAYGRSMDDDLALDAMARVEREEDEASILPGSDQS